MTVTKVRMCGRPPPVRRYPAKVADDDVPMLKLSDVSKRCGVDVDALRQLIEDGELAGVVRGPNGHPRMREDSVPEWADVVSILERQTRQHLRRAQLAFARVKTELEAVGNDLEMAIEDPYLDLGDDLTAFRAYSTRPDRTTLLSAMERLEVAVFRVRTYSDALRRARRVT